MTEGPVVPDAPRTASGGTRVLAVLGGLALVALALLVTAGFALVSFLGMGVAALVWQWRRRPYTPFAGWGGAALAAALAMVAVVAFGFATLPPGTLRQIQEQGAVAARQPREPDAVQRTVERMYPGSAAISKAETEAIAHSMAKPGVFAAVMVFGVAMGASFVGLFVGTAAWGSATVLLFGALGRWPGPGRRRRDVADPYVFAPAAHDAFDDIR